MSDFCRETGVPEPRFRRLLERMRARGQDPLSSPGFAAVVSGPGVRLRTARNLVIEVDPGFDVGFLRRLVEAIC